MAERGPGRRCVICRRQGHNARAHQDLGPEELKALREDGLAFLARGFRELGEVHPGGDLLHQLAVQQELSAVEQDERAYSDAVRSTSETASPVVANEEDPTEQRRSEPEPRRDPLAGQSYWCSDCNSTIRGQHITGCAFEHVLVHPIYPPEPSGLDEFLPVVESELLAPGSAPIIGDFDQYRDPYAEPTEDLYREAVAEHGDVIDQAVYLDQRADVYRLVGEQGPQYAPWRTVFGPAEQPRVTRPGVYHLTAEQYHSFEITGDWLSNSDAKKLLATCPAQFDYDRRNGVRKISDAFDFGHVAHTVVLGRGEQYQVFDKLDGRTKAGQAQKRERAEARAAGRTPIDREDWDLISGMVEALQQNPTALDLLNRPGRPEVCLFWRELIRVTDPQNSLYGQTVEVQRRAMLDYLPDLPEDGEPFVLVDYKTADEVKPDDKLRKKIYDYGYHRQADTYACAVEALYGRSPDVVFLLQSKRPPHLVVPVEMDTPAQLVASYENRQALEQWAECVATGVWPEYVNGVATSGIPAYIERQYEDEMVIS